MRVPLDVHSAGTETTRVKDDAWTVMAEPGPDLSTHTSKTLHDVPDPQHFDYGITACDSAAQACPVYPGRTTPLHSPFMDPSGSSLDCWRAVRGQQRTLFMAFLQALGTGPPVPPTYVDSPAVTAA